MSVLGKYNDMSIIIYQTSQVGATYLSSNSMKSELRVDVKLAKQARFPPVVLLNDP